mmetsp:Transcript_2443/g.7484  ORF Transcript_2443/g.7484 Transcript_2443/m.7484 type:complete len:479 (-) Transcript_2443:220-1656(-)
MLDESSELSPAAQAELNRVDKDKNGVLDPAEQRQVLRDAAELRSDKTKLMRFVLVMAVCLLLSLGGNFGMMFVALDLSKETKVSDKSLVSKNGDPLRTLASKHIYHASQELDANGETGREQVASLSCAAVQEGIDAIKHGENDGVVDMPDGEGTLALAVTANHYFENETILRIDGILVGDGTDPLLAECEPAKCSDPGYKCPVYGPPTSNASEARRRKLYAQKTDCIDLTDDAVQSAAETSGLQAASCSELVAEGACKMDLVYSKMCPVACGACGRAAAMSRRGRRLNQDKTLEELNYASKEEAFNAYTKERQQCGAAVLCEGGRNLAAAREDGCHIVKGDLTDGGASGEVNLPNLVDVLGKISVQNNANLDTLTMPNLIHVDAGIYVQNNANLDTLTMPNLFRVDDISVENNAKLASLTMNKLENVMGFIERGRIIVYNNANLDSLAMPNLDYVRGHIFVDPNPASCNMGDLSSNCS